MLKKFLTTMMAATLLLASPAFAQTQNFTPTELGLQILSAGQLNSQTAGQVFGAADQYLAKVPATLKGFVAPIQQYKQSMQTKLLELSNSKAAEIDSVLSPYRELTSAHLSYEQVDIPSKPELQVLAQDSNRLLKDSFKVIRSVNLANEIVKKAKESMPAHKQGNLLANSAGLGIMLISVNNMSLNAYMTALALEGEVKKLHAKVESQAKTIQARIEANPFDALSMGEELSLLLSLGSKLASVSGSLVQTSQQVPGLLQDTASLIGQVKI